MAKNHKRNGRSGFPPSKALPNNDLASHGDLADQFEAMYEKAHHLIVCGHAGLKPLNESQRYDLLGRVNLYDAVEQLAEMQRSFDVAYTGTGDLRRIELIFLVGARESWVDRVRKRIDQGHRLVSPRATAQLLREVIEHASTDTAAPVVDKNRLVHLYLSVTSEQNMRPEFEGDLPSRRARRRHAEEIAGLDLAETHAVAATIIPDIVATQLFNNPLKIELVKANTFDTWFRPWPTRSNSNGLGNSPEECFKIATGVELVDVLRLGDVIAKRGATQQQVRFTREGLAAAGVTAAAIDLLFASMALTLPDLREQLALEREAGPVGHQRYKLTQYPFLALDGSEFISLRHTWAMDKLCGSHLFFITSVGLIDTQSRSAAGRFKSSMDDIFEDVVGEVLNRIARNARVGGIINEAEMQAAWTKKKGETPSVCDWALHGERLWAVIDATNHAVNASVAQGLSTWEDYSADIERTFTENKFEQLLSTITQLRQHGGWDHEVVDDDTDFIPLVVVPDVGLPSDPLIESDIIRRSLPLFQHLQPHIYPPAILQFAELQLLEGVAENFPVNILEVIADWRREAATSGIPLQMFVEATTGQLPGSRRILASAKSLDKRLAQG
ncbi:hypothetical protein [Mycolicibacterium sp. D5.8-2]|uniref:hypothetical protein n=1 Tax=Mycolicibacterium sp. D5.8-2 TaxID=3085903 RepID=UPI00298BF768|nr:hypothetical protein [Mycolicibacterium sp. D5.8-2]MDW5610660.1 hypothetical protein [Mycolicibacterium sp. D5.8-2]